MNGKYVVKMGKRFFISAENYIGDKRVNVSSDIREANMFLSIENARKISEEYGGKVFKIDLELEEV